MKKISLAAIALVMFLSVSCNEAHETESIESIIQSEEFYQSVSTTASEIGVTVKGGEITDDEAMELLEPLFISAQNYLLTNGYDYTVDFAERDPGIIMTALGLLEFDMLTNSNDCVTKASGLDVLGCVLLGEDVGALVNAGAKQIAKKIAKKVISRIVPGVGYAVAVVSAVVCVSELE